jgi:hypothetical protein
MRKRGHQLYREGKVKKAKSFCPKNFRNCACQPKRLRITDLYQQLALINLTTTYFRK